MRNKIFALALCFTMFLGNQVLADDDFYIVPMANPNITATNTNTAMGKGSLKSITTGVGNTAVGNDSLTSNQTGVYNTATGYWSMFNNKTGWYNTANGNFSLLANVSGAQNVAVGHKSLYSNNTGSFNTAVGFESLYANQGAIYNTASGYQALKSNTTGYRNTGVGTLTLSSNTSGYSNTALGYQAGAYLNGDFTGNYNIYIGENVYPVASNESYTIRIGNSNQIKTFIAGINDSYIDGSTVLIDSNGRLGIPGSSIRYKEQVQDMENESSSILQLRPVVFYYKPEYSSGSRTLQYGLIAEEVAKTCPNLVGKDPNTGEPRTVYYQQLNSMLLNEIQKQQRKINSLEDRLSKLEAGLKN